MSKIAFTSQIWDSAREPILPINKGNPVKSRISSDMVKNGLGGNRTFVTA